MPNETTPPVVGIEHVKQLVKVGLTFGQDVAADLKDGKISFMETMGLLPDVFAVIGVVKSWGDIKSELKNVLTPENMLDLENFVMANFNIPNAKVLIFVQHALSTVISLFSLVDEFKHIKDPIVP